MTSSSSNRKGNESKGDGGFILESKKGNRGLRYLDKTRRYRNVYVKVDGPLEKWERVSFFKTNKRL